MLMSVMFCGPRKFIQWVSRYDLYSTLDFASGRVANRRNRQGYYSSSRLASHKIQRTLQAVQLQILGLQRNHHGT